MEALSFYEQGNDDPLKTEHNFHVEIFNPKSLAAFYDLETDLQGLALGMNSHLDEIYVFDLLRDLQAPWEN
jgi:hypothetical protein